VAQAIAAAHARHGYSIHLNCHSMPAVASSHATDFPVWCMPISWSGNRDASTSSAALALQGLRALEIARLPRCRTTTRTKGVELVRRYGKPAEHRHSIQLEINPGST